MQRVQRVSRQHGSILLCQPLRQTVSNAVHVLPMTFVDRAAAHRDPRDTGAAFCCHMECL